MNLSATDRAVGEPDQCNPFKLSPTARTVLLPESVNVADSIANRNDFDVGNIADDFSNHMSS
jgi:hypothetical protein